MASPPLPREPEALEQRGLAALLRATLIRNRFEFLVDGSQVGKTGEVLPKEIGDDAGGGVERLGIGRLVTGEIDIAVGIATQLVDAVLLLGLDRCLGVVGLLFLGRVGVGLFFLGG